MPSVVAIAPPRTIRRYCSSQDLRWLHGFWHRAMPARWCVSSPELHKVLSRTTLNLIAEQAGTPIGFCAVGSKGRGPAELLVVLVEPAFQRSGVGSALLKEAEQALQIRGMDHLRVGYGNDGNYFWPGVPAHTHAWRFFASRGWKEDERNCDLVQELTTYITPSWVYSRVSRAEVTLQLATPELDDQVMAFEQQWFSQWTDFYANATTDPEERNVIVALNLKGAVVGSVLIGVVGAARWDADSGVRHGTINVLGVAEDQQGQGIGLALAARAMEILKERGCVKCYIQWTGLIDWLNTIWARRNSYEISPTLIA